MASRDCGPLSNGNPSRRFPSSRSWLVDHPEGRFTTSMALESQLLTQLVESRKAKRGLLWY